MVDIFDITNETAIDLEKYLPDFEAIFAHVKTVLDITEPLELSLTFVNPTTQVELNQQYRNKDYVADVLTFPLEDDSTIDFGKILGIRVLGDIFICPQKAIEQAETYQHSLRRELAFLFTHGILHILGYDHIASADEEIMFGLQRKILDDLQITRNLIQ
ncbi:rRNA maturation RNase YbeY [Spiroplasma chrysopicola]|uniref:Endoribonuclease YbeY n=1 Tax=Spiroplasma chrysopicola DF-1 TaxID=1276227 RepID=R4UGE3_9MOLU|nr:rRNA maturation RNase YbeY [Spiroplasma chrysopicola]AGM25180.1 metalloprotease [Spiroplasma chrysopicola DF-1]